MLTAGEQSNSLTLAAFSDLHMWRFGWDWDFSPKRLLGLANLALRRARHYPIAAQTALIERLATENADHLLFTGDISTTSLRTEFEQGQMLLAPIVLRWGGRFHAIPGNHDRYTPRTAGRHDFEQLFLGREQTYPYTVRLNENWSLVAFDCSVPRTLSSRGRMSDDQLAKLGAELARERAAGRQLIVMGHYPLVYPKGIWASWEHVLPERGRVRALLESQGVKLYIHGHKHYRWLTQSGSMLHANCGSAGYDSRNRRPGYLRIQLDATEVSSIQAVVMNSSWSPAHPVAEGSWKIEDLTSEMCRPVSS
ncbi:metallophosphoesterase [bacterium]|nr:metallophosphoesterase [bacterium]